MLQGYEYMERTINVYIYLFLYSYTPKKKATQKTLNIKRI